MSEPYIGEIRMTGYNFAQRGWAFCDGQLLSISSNTALFSILGTIYGGDGRTTFGLPDLRGRVPFHAGQHLGSSYRLGQRGGEERHTLTVPEMPNHNHTASVSSNNGTSPIPTDNSIGVYNNTSGDGSNLVNMNNAMANSGGQPHENTQPSAVVSFQIALVGIFPSRS